MQSLYSKLTILTRHLILLDKTFKEAKNYSDKVDYETYKQNLKIFQKLGKEEKLKFSTIRSNESDKGVKTPLSFVDEVYSESDRQMKLADVIEFLFFSRGIYYLFQSDQFRRERVSKFLELNLRFVNILMIYETLTVDKKLREAVLVNLKPLIKKEKGYRELVNWNDYVGLSKKDKRYNKKAPNLYFDSLLPKTAGGLWHEILVYCFILKYNIGYIFPLLLTQKPISLQHKLSPPDLIILHNKTYRYYGIEIGNLKERQSGGFMAPSGVPVIPIDTLNARISDRCPTCGKWIGICPKVINDFCNTDSYDKKPINEIRCLTECNLFSLTQKLEGACNYMKFKYTNKNWQFDFADGKHHHYRCCILKNSKLGKKIIESNTFKDLERLNTLIRQSNITNQEKHELDTLKDKLKSRYSYVKTHSIYYSELITLYKMNTNQSETEIESNEKNNE